MQGWIFGGFSKLKLAALTLGILLFYIIYALVPVPAGLTPGAWKVIACTVLILTWWVTEALPIPVTSLVPLMLFPLLGISDIKQTAIPYGSPMVFLFLGGFLLAAAMERWSLHMRIALNIVKFAGTDANGIIGGFMLATGALSMWMSNTATTVMMLPIGISIIDLMAQDAKTPEQKASYEKFFGALMLGIAYAASIGGMATPIGTPPNIIFSGFMQSQFGFEVSFLDWMMVGVPTSLVLLGVTWVLLTKICLRNKLGHLHGSKAMITKELEALGPVSLAEKMVLMVFCLTAFFWITRSVFAEVAFFKLLTDEGIAIIGAGLLFILPGDIKKGKFVMDWESAENLPWGILLLFGGGMSLAAALENNGVISALGQSIASLHGMSMVWIVMIIIAVVVLMSELMSNMALTAIFLPIAAALAVGFHENPLIFTIATTLAASCGFMLPMATPPNAIVFGSRHVTMPQMVKAGVLLDIISILFLTLVVFTLLVYVFDIDWGVVPDWAIPAKSR